MYNIETVSQSSIQNVCPLCCSQLKWYFLNFNEKCLMCENVSCEYPFGYEDLQIIQEDAIDSEVGSNWSRQNVSSNSSICSYTTADIDQLNGMCEADDIKMSSESHQKPSKEITPGYEQAASLSNVHSKICEIEKKNMIKSLTNKAYLRTLYNLQSLSGVKILEPSEIEKLTSDTVKESEVKIGINECKNVTNILVNVEPIFEEVKK